MTFTQIVAAVLDRLNLSSTNATTRIGQRVNESYRKITSSIGLETSRRLDTNIVIDPTDPDSTLPDYELTSYEKVLRIALIITNSAPKVLEQVTYDDLTTNMTNDTHTPRAWAEKILGAHSVTITLDSFSPTDSFTLNVIGYDRALDLSGAQEPNFPEDFHDVLIEAVMADELRKMEKSQLAMIAENKYQERLSDLRMFLAKSAYLDIIQGKTNRDWKPYYSTNRFYPF